MIPPGKSEILTGDGLVIEIYYKKNILEVGRKVFLTIVFLRFARSSKLLLRFYNQTFTAPTKILIALWNFTKFYFHPSPINKNKLKNKCLTHDKSIEHEEFVE